MNVTLRLELGELRIDLFDSADVDRRDLGVVDHRARVVAPDDAARRALHRLGRHPRLVDEPRRHVAQHRYVAPADYYPSSCKTLTNQRATLALFVTYLL